MAELGHGVDVALQPEPDLHLLKVQLRGQSANGRLAEQLGGIVPGPGRWINHGAMHCCWLAPSEWLVTGDGDAIGRLAFDLERSLAAEVALVTNITDGCASLLLTGTLAAERIASACPLDLRPDSFPPGACARSLIGDAHLFLARLPNRATGPAYRLVVDQTMADYAVRLLAPCRAHQKSGLHTQREHAQ